MSIRSTLQRSLATAAAIAALATNASAQSLGPPTAVASGGEVIRRPAVARPAVVPARGAINEPAPAPAARAAVTKVRKDAPPPAPTFSVNPPATVFEYMLTPSELGAPDLDPIAAAPFSMPTVGAAPGGGSRWLWILPLGLLPFFNGGDDDDRQTAESALPADTPPVSTPGAPPGAPPSPAPAVPSTPPNLPGDVPPVIPPVIPPANTPPLPGEIPPTSTVPEPGTLALVATGLALAGAAARRRRG
jgi:hypothetical protein